MLAGFVGLHPVKRFRRTRSEMPSQASPSTAVPSPISTGHARCLNRVANLASSLRQAVMELDEAAAIITSFGLPGTGYIFKKAADRKRAELERI